MKRPRDEELRQIVADRRDDPEAFYEIDTLCDDYRWCDENCDGAVRHLWSPPCASPGCPHKPCAVHMAWCSPRCDLATCDFHTDLLELTPCIACAHFYPKDSKRYVTMNRVYSSTVQVCQSCAARVTALADYLVPSRSGLNPQLVEMIVAFALTSSVMSAPLWYEELDVLK